jgi:hypothetical protein
MIRTAAALLAAIAAFLPLAARAQDQTLNIYFEPLKGGEFAPLNKAIQTALSQPPMQLVARPFAGVLVLSVPDRIDVDHKQVSGTQYSFIVAFTRDGDSLGQSQQSCGAAKLSDCTDQLLQDVRSVTASH